MLSSCARSRLSVWRFPFRPLRTCRPPQGCQRCPVDIPRSELAIFCASTGNPRQFIQRRGRILRTHKDKKFAYIHDLVVVPEVSSAAESFNMERNLLAGEIRRVKDFALLSENAYSSVQELDDILEYYNLSIF